MKKFCVIFLILISCVPLCACNNYKSLKSNLSEIRQNIFVGSSENFDITFMSGKREKDYVVNGYNTELIDFGIITITTNFEVDASISPSFALTVETLRYEDILEKNPFDGTYVADIKVLVDDNISSITVKIFMGEIVEEITLNNLSCSWEVSPYSALKIAYKNLSDELAPLMRKEFLGEVYIKIIKDTILNNNNYYWYVNFVSRNGIYHSIIIDPMTSEILAKK